MPPPKARGARGAGRRGHAEEHEEGGAERWLVTYADMLTLLLVLFIVLFSISVVNTSKFISLKTSLAAVFGDGTKGMLSGGAGLLDKGEDNSTKAMSTSLTGNPMVPSNNMNKAVTNSSAVLPGGYTKQDVSKEVANFKAIEKAIAKSLAAHGLRNSVRFAITNRGLVITVVTNSLIFPGNSARLLAQGQRILASVTPPLVPQKRSIEVDGYTNQERASTYPYPSGWELSSARASAVVRYLTAHRLPEQRLSAVGLNDLNPLYPRSDPRAATLNRRVEIVVRSDLPSTAAADLQAAGSP